MSDELKAFLAVVGADAGLQDQIKSAADLNAVVAVAKDAGHLISADELKEISESEEFSERELTQKELAGVSGGLAFTLFVGAVLVGGAIRKYK